MNYLISLKCRFPAVIINLSGIAIFLLLLLLWKFLLLPFFFSLHLFTEIFYAFSICFSLTILIANIAFLIFTKRKEYFVNLAAKDNANRSINVFCVMSLAYTVGFFVLMLLEPAYKDFESTPEFRSAQDGHLDDMINMINIIFVFVTGFYSIDAIISAIFSLRGYRFKNHLIYPFIRDK